LNIFSVLERDSLGHEHLGSATIKTIAKTDDEPGYFRSARMISEAGLALVLDFSRLPYKRIGGAGALTPMAALKDVYIERGKEYYI